LVARPPPDSGLYRLLARMLVASDNEAANELLARLGDSDADGAARVNELLATLGLRDSELYGGFLAAAGRGDPIPLTVESQPAFEGKYTTAWDLARLHRFVHLAAGNRGPLLDVSGSFTAADARFLLYVLAHSADRGKLDRYLPADVVVAHKAGWITEARHDCGVVYAPSGAFVAAVMTWTGAAAGDASDELAGRVAKLALDHFRAPDGWSASGIAYAFSL
ncbi:MAG: class A beta-lactamase-related serine hydrolase, partial [Actinomycetota bacterium]|nr:class A beta-lactamase-related serine hydrolase [Actinomycetota bacterium]